MKLNDVVYHFNSRYFAKIINMGNINNKEDYEWYSVELIRPSIDPHPSYSEGIIILCEPHDIIQEQNWWEYKYENLEANYQKLLDDCLALENIWDYYNEENE